MTVEALPPDSDTAPPSTSVVGPRPRGHPLPRVVAAGPGRVRSSSLVSGSMVPTDVLEGTLQPPTSQRTPTVPSAPRVSNPAQCTHVGGRTLQAAGRYSLQVEIPPQSVRAVTRRPSGGWKRTNGCPGPGPGRRSGACRRRSPTSPARTARVIEVLVVDNGSTDGTMAAAVPHRHRGPRRGEPHARPRPARPDMGRPRPRPAGDRHGFLWAGMLPQHRLEAVPRSRR